MRPIQLTKLYADDLAGLPPRGVSVDRVKAGRRCSAGSKWLSSTKRGKIWSRFACAFSTANRRSSTVPCHQGNQDEEGGRQIMREWHVI